MQDQNTQIVKNNDVIFKKPDNPISSNTDKKRTSKLLKGLIIFISFFIIASLLFFLIYSSYFKPAEKDIDIEISVTPTEEYNAEGTYIYEGEFLKVTLPSDWTLKEYTDEEDLGLEKVDVEGEYYGIAAFNINSEDQVLFSMNVNNGKDLEYDCKFYTFPDTPEDWVQKAETHTVLECPIEKVKISDNDFIEFTLLGLKGRYIRTENTIVWMDRDNEGVIVYDGTFLPAYGLENKLIFPYLIGTVAGLNNNYTIEINPDITENEASLLFQSLDTIEQNCAGCEYQQGKFLLFDMDDWETYSSNNYNLKFKYPQDWEVEEDDMIKISKDDLKILILENLGPNACLFKDTSNDNIRMYRAVSGDITTQDVTIINGLSGIFRRFSTPTWPWFGIDELQDNFCYYTYYTSIEGNVFLDGGEFNQIIYLRSDTPRTQEQLDSAYELMDNIVGTLEVLEQED